MRTSLWELQKSLFNRLSNDTALNQIITGTYDQVSETAVFPYITIGEPDSVPNERKDVYGENVTVVIHTWSQYSGKKQSYDMINAILKALSSSPLQVGGFSLWHMQNEQIQVISDIDGKTWHGIVRIRFYIDN